MARALALARRGLYSTRPNPAVGCVLVRDGVIVGEGWHRRAGEPHAEIHALAQAGAAARGATCYVTLEPCCHHGRTPPCADALITAGVARVVAAMRDPNPRVDGGGLARLADAGIAVEHGLLAQAAAELNRGFVHRMVHGRPWVQAKMGASLDGRTALPSGESRWITSVEARRDVQRLRARAGVILTGIGTVLADDPELTVREPPVGFELAPTLRAVLDSRLRIPPASRVLAGGGTLVYTAVRDDAARTAVEARAATVVQIEGGPRPDLGRVLADLAARGVNEVLIEAGPTLCGAALQAGFVDELVLYLAPRLLGAGRGVAVLDGVDCLADAPALRIVEERRIGPDLRLVLAPLR
ncbi:MAG: bifunctional diaminohydroxyphosphoribosylaminopyrimidine deaminase/5-amino-6-(5-phosphoribosylamino)uracil reductase RibD [Gammaproteobacteria bacterium]